MKTIYFISVLIYTSPDLFAQDSTEYSAPTNKALSLALNNFYLSDGEIQFTYLPNKDISFRFGLYTDYNVSESKAFSSLNPPTITKYTEFVISPSVAYLQKLFPRENVIPYVGAQLRIKWYLKNYGFPKFTQLEPSIIFGVESWISKMISVSGEVATYSIIYLNRDSGFNEYGLSDERIIFNFYF